MAELLEGKYAHLHPTKLNAFYRLRHDVFVDERGWEDLRKPDGREIDQFDTASAVHIGAFRDDTAVGYQRLLPTTEPHLLTDVYPWLCERGCIPRGLHIVEWGRTCVAREYRRGGRPNPIAAELFLAFMEYCLPRGIAQCTGEGNPSYISRFSRLGFEIEPLGLPQHIDDGPVIAVLMSFDESTLEKTRQVCGISQNVLAPMLPEHTESWEHEYV